MLGRFDIIISAAVVLAVSKAVPSEYWSLSYVCTDLALYFAAAVAYGLLWQSRQRFKSNQAPPKKATEDLSVETEHEYSTSDIELSEDDEEERDKAEQEEPVEAKYQQPHFDVCEHVVLMQKYASERSISGAMRTFRLIQQSGNPLSSLMYNTVLRAWVNCGNIQAAEDWMEEMIDAAMADETSFTVLIKALVMTRAPDKAKAFIKVMQQADLQPSIEIFNELLIGFAQEGLFDDGLSLLDEMHTQGVQSTHFTFAAIVKLMDSSRKHEYSFDRVHQTLRKLGIEPNSKDHSSELRPSQHRPAHEDLTSSMDKNTGIEPSLVALPRLPLPRLASVILRAQGNTSRLCAHEIRFTGSQAQVKRVRRTLKQHGFMKDEGGAWPLNGHWETDHGLTVIIEGKMVRWSRQRASRLHFTRKDRGACVLAVYGEPANGQLVSATIAPGATRALRWDNGDVWHSCDGHVIGRNTIFSQTMSKMLRDEMQDEAYRTRMHEVLKCVSKHRLGVPMILEDAIVRFLGKDLYYLFILFESSWNPPCDNAHQAEADVFDSISRRHPRLGLRHCWAGRSTDCCGQRTLVNGMEVNEDIYNRHIKAVK